MWDKPSFFSISYELISVGRPLEYDLYVNSSSLKEREKFVRIYPLGEVLERDEIEQTFKKYFQLYVAEDQRSSYLKSLVRSEVDDVKKTEVLKSAALTYLHNIFDSGKEFSTDYLARNIDACKEVVGAMVDVLEEHSIDSLRGLIGSLSFHDFYTYDHSINVSMYCITIYKTLNPNASRRELIHAGLGGLLHDLGKVKISTEILNKPAGLTPEEYNEIKKHPDFGLDLLLNGGCQVDPEIDLKIISRVVHEHHENIDGTGYPAKLKGREQIHLLARVCAIADFFDAITTKRAYSQVLSVAEAMNTMKKFRGTKLDSDIFDLFDQHIRYVRADSTRDIRLSDSFDPTIPYAQLPIEEIKQFQQQMSFGKIKILDEGTKKKG